MVSKPLFPDFSAPFWQNIDPAVLAREDVVSKMHSIELLENISPYRGATEPYFRRVWRALDNLQVFSEVSSNWLTAALVIFSNIIYLPEALLEDAWRSLYLDLYDQTQSEKGVPETSWWSKIHLIENDPTGMTASFCHLNKMEGRLDHEKMSRVDSTDKLADVLLDLLNPLKREAAARAIFVLVQRPTWAMLVDRSLSGHSLASDIRRIIYFQSLVNKAGGKPPVLIILCQVLTEAALRHINETIRETYSEIGEHGLPSIAINRAVFLDGTYQINSLSSELITDLALREDVSGLCNWFSAKFLHKDDQFTRMMQRSGDNLAFGYRGCGLTLVDYQNCPTDSLPLLWHGSTADDVYTAPYPRIHSRIGSQVAEPSADKWAQILTNRDIEMSVRQSLVSQ